MIKKLVSHLGAYKAASIKTPLFAALEAIMDVLLPTIMAFIIDQGIEKGDMNAVVNALVNDKGHDGGQQHIHDGFQSREDRCQDRGALVLAQM